jgi:hypothetical protein
MEITPSIKKDLNNICTNINRYIEIIRLRILSLDNTAMISGVTLQCPINCDNDKLSSNHKFKHLHSTNKNSKTLECSESIEIPDNSYHHKLFTSSQDIFQCDKKL